MRSFFIITMISFLLTACTAQPIIPTAILTKSATSTSALTATKFPTTTATEIPIKQFIICTSENFLAHSVTEEDLNGPIQRWLRTIEKPFDPTQIRIDIPLIMYEQNGNFTEITYSFDNAPNFIGENKGKEPFRRYLLGNIKYSGAGGRKYTAAVFATEYFDINNPQKNQFVVSVVSFSGDYWTEEHMVTWLGHWQNKMNVTVIIPNDIDGSTGEKDPLIAKTFARYPDMQERFLRFVHNNDFKPGGDMSALSEDGMILGAKIIIGANGTSVDWYQ